MTLVVEAQGVTHDVQEHHLTDGGDAMYVRTHCGGYIKESVFTLEPKEGVPTCLRCIQGRRLWEEAIRIFVDASRADGIDDGAAEQRFRDMASEDALFTARPLPR